MTKNEILYTLYELKSAEQAALDDYSHDSHRELLQQRIDALDYAMAVIRNSGWVPCSERLPEKGGQYIVTVKTDRGQIYSRPSHFYEDKGKWCYQTFKDEKLNKIFRVTAWMPLPEPYKEGE